MIQFDFKFHFTCVVPSGLYTERCNPRCEAHQCCDKDGEGVYKCFCLQAKVNNWKEYVKRPCESMYGVISGSFVLLVLIFILSRLLRNCRHRCGVCS